MMRQEGKKGVGRQNGPSLGASDKQIFVPGFDL